MIIENTQLLGCPDLEDLTERNFNHGIACGEVEVLPSAAAACDGEMVELEDSMNRICSQMLVPYPPGIPVFLPGLRINSNMIELVKNVINNGSVHDVHGIYYDEDEYYVKVMKEEEFKKQKTYSQQNLVVV